MDGKNLSIALRDVETALVKEDLDFLKVSMLSWQIPILISRDILRVVSSLLSFKLSKNKLGIFITVTGLDKTGKETQVFNPFDRPGVVPLIKHLHDKGYQVLGIRQPSYDTRLGKLISCYLGKPSEDISIKGDVDKDVAWILWSLDRAQHNEKVSMWLTLSNRHLVISKRWTESNVVYQYAYGINPDRILKVEKKIVKQDATIVLELPVEVALSRLSAKGDAFENAAILEKAARYYRELESIFPYGKVYRIDANGDLRTVNERLLNMVDLILAEKEGSA